jgi:hypothetical protein
MSAMISQACLQTRSLMVRRLTIRRLVVACAAVLVAAMAAGCGSSSQTAGSTTTSGLPQPAKQPAATGVKPGATTSACRPVPDKLRRSILAHVVLAKARLVNVRAVGANGVPGYYYVSGTIAGWGAKDLLATWATKDLEGARQIYSVDSNAALISAYGSSANLGDSLNIASPSAYHSRVCVAGPRAAHGEPAPMSGGGAQSGK